MSKGPHFKPDIKDVKDALEQHRGIVTYAAKSLGVMKNALYVYIKENDLMSFINEIRYQKYEDMLDVAEDVIYYRMGRQKEEPALALKAAIYYLDKKGAARGWAGKSAEDTILEIHEVKNDATDSIEFKPEAEAVLSQCEETH